MRRDGAGRPTGREANPIDVTRFIRVTAHLRPYTPVAKRNEQAYLRIAMIQGRPERQRTIVDLLREGVVRGQDEVAAKLSEAGFQVTQATVARDLDQIGAVRVKREGKFGYVLPEKLGDRNWPVDRLQRIFVEWVQSVETSGNMVVVRTPPGSAHLVGLAVDQAKFPEVVGTIAGDDALFIAVRSGLPSEPLAQRLRELMGER